MKKDELIPTLEKYGIAPSKSRGQNFLIDTNLLDAMVREMGIQEGELILEVGPGPAALTREILKAGAELHAIEFDTAIQRFLEDNIDHSNFHLHKADACKVDYQQILDLPRDFRCLANLPYSISSIFIAIMTELSSRPSEMYYLLQREMAERLASSYKNKSYGSLTVRVQALYNVKISRIVPPEVFFPPPKVQSAFVVLKLKEDLPSEQTFKTLCTLVKAAFSQRRKIAFKLMKSATHKDLGKAYEELNLDPKLRAEHISVDDYIKLAEQLNQQ